MVKNLDFISMREGFSLLGSGIFRKEINLGEPVELAYSQVNQGVLQMPRKKKTLKILIFKKIIKRKCK